MFGQKSEPELIPYEPIQAPLGRVMLVLVPHPDDEVFGCGGLLAWVSGHGVRVRVLVLTDGGVAWDVTQREAESRAAASILEYLRHPDDLQFLRQPDRGLLPDAALLCVLEAHARSIGADWIVAPSPFEVHPDHRAACVAGIELAKRIACRLMCYEVGQPLIPNCLVDITALAERKQQAMACFESQLFVQGYADQILALNRYRSFTLGPGVRYAEAFRLVSEAELQQGAAGVIAALTRELRERLQPEEVFGQRSTAVIQSGVESTPDSSTEQASATTKKQVYELHAALERIQALENSLSWKVTRPLRSVLDTFTSWQNRRREHRQKAAVDSLSVQPIAPVSASISVLIRSMDRDSLGRALASVQAQQGVTDMRIVVVNATGRAHRGLPADSGPWPVRWLEPGQPLERAAAANCLLAAVETDFALFLDDDDEVLPGHLERLSARLITDPTAIAAYSDVEYGQLREGGWQVIHCFAAPFDRRRLLLENFMPVHSVLFRYHPEIRFDERLPVFEDWDFLLQLAESGAFLHVAGVSARYMASGSEGSRVSERNSVNDSARQFLQKKWMTRMTPIALDSWMGEMRALYHGHYQREAELIDMRSELCNARIEIERLRLHAAAKEAEIDQLKSLTPWQTLLAFFRRAKASR